MEIVNCFLRWGLMLQVSTLPPWGAVADNGDANLVARCQNTAAGPVGSPPIWTHLDSWAAWSCLCFSAQHLSSHKCALPHHSSAKGWRAELIMRFPIYTDDVENVHSLGVMDLGGVGRSMRPTDKGSASSLLKLHEPQQGKLIANSKKHQHLPLRWDSKVSFHCKNTHSLQKGTERFFYRLKPLFKVKESEESKHNRWIWGGEWPRGFRALLCMPILCPKHGESPYIV